MRVGIFLVNFIMKTITGKIKSVQTVLLIIAVLLSFVMSGCSAGQNAAATPEKASASQTETASAASVSQGGSSGKAPAAEKKTASPSASTISTASESDAYQESEFEKTIFSFIQIPKEMHKDEEWAGIWSDIEAGNQTFFFFGCGICCISNIISTLTEFTVTPDLMFSLTKKHAGYNPDSGIGAVSWEQMAHMCKLFGFDTEVRKKPAEYSEFRRDVQDADATIVLVCKDDDDKLWFYTKGHYVTLWSYDEKSDTVFVSDASGLFNRDRVQLSDVYNALKSRSAAQYMLVKKNADKEIALTEEEIMEATRSDAGYRLASPSEWATPSEATMSEATLSEATSSEEAQSE